MSATTGIPASITTQTRLGTVEQNADGSSEIEAYSTGSNGRDPQTGR